MQMLGLNLRSATTWFALSLGGLVVVYAVGLMTGLASQVGYASESRRLSGGITTGSVLPVRYGIPLRLQAGQAVVAEFEVDARFGAVNLTVRPHLFARHSALQAAVLTVEGRRCGRATFVASSSGWHVFDAQATPNGGPRCHKPNVTVASVLAGDPDCPAYDVTYRVKWHWLGSGETGAAAASLVVPGPGGAFATARLRD